MIACRKNNCTMKYVGETKRILKFRLADHRGYVNNHDYTTATGEHFNSPGHSLSDLSITILERVKTNDDLYRKEREKYHIRKFNTYYKGLNKQPLNRRGNKRVALVITYIVSYYLINRHNDLAHNLYRSMFVHVQI